MVEARLPAGAQFLLASRSPRRIEFLREAGFRFDTAPADVPELPAPGETAAGYALRVATDKARAVQQEWPAALILGADTDVVLEGRILGKPVDDEDAAAMLAALSGRRHEVVSAVVLLQGARLASAVTVTTIEFAALAPDDIARYVATGEPRGKAGAYGIQGSAARFVTRVEGSYTGVVGLPMAETVALLADFGIHPG